MSANFKTVTEAAAHAPWMVMVHGMSQDHRVFSAQVAAFKDRYRILLIDLPGHGLSADIPGPFGHLELASRVVGAMDHAGVAACDYWATHTGTSLGLLIACETPHRFRCLILEGTVLPGHTTPSVAFEYGRACDLARTRGVAHARRRWFDDAQWFQVMRERPEECRAAAMRAIICDFSGAPWLYDGPATPAAPIDAKLASIDVPALVYNGDHDAPDFLDTAEFLERRLPRAKRVTIADAGAFPAWEFPDHVNRLVADFLASAHVVGDHG